MVIVQPRSAINVVAESKFPIPQGELERYAASTDIVFNGLAVSSGVGTATLDINAPSPASSVVSFSTNSAPQWAILTDASTNLVFEPTNNAINKDVIIATGDVGMLCVLGSSSEICLQGAASGSPVKVLTSGLDPDISIQLIPKGFGEILTSPITALNSNNAVATKKYVDDNSGGGGSGNVVGPVSATNNAVARYDLATGKLIKNSGVLIDDSNNVTGVANLSGTLTTNSQPNVTSVGTLTGGTWNATAITASNGGTGLTSYTTGDLIYASGAATLAQLSDVATGNALISGGVSAAPSWGKIGLSTHVSGTLGVGNGGTGQTTLTSNGVLIGAGASAVTTGKQAPAGQFIGDSDTQTLTNKTLTAAGGNVVTASLLKTATTEVAIGSSTAPSAGKVLISIDSANASWATINIATQTQGILPITSGGSGVGVATGTAGSLVLSQAPSLVSPTITGAATYNGLTITTTTGSLTVGNGVNFTANGSVTLTGTSSANLGSVGGNVVFETATETLTNKTFGNATGVNGVLTVTDTTQSSSVSTGALVVAGGTGIAKNLFVGGTSTFADNITVATGKTITINYTPTSATDAVNKAYIDSVGTGLSPKASALVATTAALGSNTYNNGAAGVGATLTSTVNVAFPSVDGYALTLNGRILVKDEVAGANNGIYTLTTVGSGATPWQLTRATDNDQSTEFVGAYLFVANGTINGGSSWVCVNPTAPTVGTTSIMFSQFSSANASVGANLGTGAQVYASNTSSTLNFRSILGTAQHITATQNTNDITLDIGANVGITTSPLSQFASTTSLQLAGIISDKTGSAGSLVFSSGPSLTAPVITGAATYNGLTVTTTTGTLTVANGVNFTANGSVTITGTSTVAFGSVGGNVVFEAATETLTNKTLTGATNTLTASLLKTASTEVSISGGAAPTSGQVLVASSSTTAGWSTLNVATQIQGILPVLNGGSGTNTATGTAGSLVLSNGPSLTAPVITGAATYNGLSITTTTGTLTIANGVTLTANGSLTLTGSGTVAFGSGGNVVFDSSTQTLTNKTMTGATNTLTASLLKTASTEVSVSASAAPTSGQVLLASNGTTASWGTLNLATQVQGVLSVVNGGSGTNTATGTAGSLVLSNSPTITTPTIAQILNGGTLTLPSSTDTLVARATADTLTNKTATSNTNNLIARELWVASGASSVSSYAAAAPTTGQVFTATSSTTAAWQAPSIAIGTAFATATPTIGQALNLIFTGTTNVADWTTTTTLTRGSATGNESKLVADSRGKKTILVLDSNYGGKIVLHPGRYSSCHLFMRDATFVDKMYDGGYNAPVYADQQMQNKLLPSGAGITLSGATGLYGSALALDYYGQVLAVGGPQDNSGVGAVWLYSRSITGASFVSAAPKLLGTGTSGSASLFGTSVAISGDGQFLAVGAPGDGTGATAQFGGVWMFSAQSGTQLGVKLVGTGSSGGVVTGERQGQSVAISNNGDTLAVSGDGRSVWLYYQSNATTWLQQTTRINYNPTSSAPTAAGSGGATWGSVALSSDGHTMVLGSIQTTGIQKIWIYERNGGPSAGITWNLVDSFGSITGWKVALSGNAETLLAAPIGGGSCNVFSRTILPYDTYATDNGPYTWTQNLVTPAGSPNGGIATNYDGSTCVIGDTANGGVYVYLRESQGLLSLRGVYPSTSYLISGTGGLSAPLQGTTAAVSGFGNSLAVGGPGDNTNVGAVWTFA